MARAKACKLRKMPRIVPFSLHKPENEKFSVSIEERNLDAPAFEAKLLMTLTTMLDAETKINFRFVKTTEVLFEPIEKRIKPIQRTIFD